MDGVPKSFHVLPKMDKSWQIQIKNYRFAFRLPYIHQYWKDVTLFWGRKVLVSWCKHSKKWKPWKWHLSYDPGPTPPFQVDPGLYVFGCFLWGKNMFVRSTRKFCPGFFLGVYFFRFFCRNKRDFWDDILTNPGRVLECYDWFMFASKFPRYILLLSPQGQFLFLGGPPAWAIDETTLRNVIVAWAEVLGVRLIGCEGF